MSGCNKFSYFFLARNFWRIKSEKDFKKKDLSLKLRFFQLCVEFYQQILIRLVLLRMNAFLGNFVYVYNVFWLIRLSSFCIPPASLPAHSPLLKSLPHTYAFDLVLRPKEFYALDGWGRDLKDYFFLGISPLLADTGEGRNMVFSCASTFENLF